MKTRKYATPAVKGLTYVFFCYQNVLLHSNGAEADKDIPDSSSML